MSIRLLIISITTAIFLLGCTNSIPDIAPSKDSFIYRGHDFGLDRNALYRQGVIDGCKTSDGDYTKDHTAYETDTSYHTGWEDGRLHCKGTSAQ
jgi:hypothetical protein